MINDQAYSARAEKTRKALPWLVALALGGSLAQMPSVAYGNEGPRPTPKPASAFEQISLPPIPYLQTMPWLDWEPGTAITKVDRLLSPVLGPSGIRLDPAAPDRDRQQPATS
jgi:hypothetical protein